LVRNFEFLEISRNFADFGGKLVNTQGIYLLEGFCVIHIAAPNASSAVAGSVHCMQRRPVSNTS